MAELNRVEVEILGQKYTIRSAAEAGYVRELAAYLEKRVLEIRGGGGGQDAARLLALAALYITDELFRLRDERSEADRAAGARLGALRELLDAVVTET
jgi:cell division protein ZapA (FtsZ GTPase activity inhibitor)